MRGHRNLNRLGYFAAVVEHGSFTAAADALGITKAVVSQQVARLEAEVGTALLIRTTRQVRPTEAGAAFHARCAAILRDAEGAFEQLSQAASAPVGTLRVTAPLDYGISVVVPAVAAFRQHYPDCDAALILTDRTIDLVAERIDVAIRVGWLADSTLRARRIGAFRQLLVGAPALVRSVPRGAAPEVLAPLPFVANAVLRSPLHWRFSRRNQRRAVRFTAVLTMDATMAVHAAVLAGGGLSVLPDFLVASDLKAGRLLPVLPDWQLPGGGVHLVFPAAGFRPPKTTAFVEILTRVIRHQAAPA